MDMPLASGSKLGFYEVLSPLGAGGMGEVYRAHDTKLGREVAIKILPAEVVDDEERLGRFRREAQVLASLNHPHIGAIHGLEEDDGRPFLVLEIVDGETLAERMSRGAIAVEEVVALARQVAEALEHAHAKGIVHRDLKPANIKITPEGNLWEVSLETGVERALTDLTGRRGSLGSIALATDGDALYFTWEEDIGNIWVMDVLTDESLF